MYLWLLSLEALLCELAQSIMQIDTMNEKPLVFGVQLRLKFFRYCRCSNEVSIRLPDTHVTAWTWVQRFEITIPCFQNPGCVWGKVNSRTDLIMKRGLLIDLGDLSEAVHSKYSYFDHLPRHRVQPW